MYYAHTHPKRPPEEWDPLMEHSERTAALAAEFCRAFGAAEAGRLAGWRHDLGKYQPEFQKYLLKNAEAGHTETGRGGPPHSIVGAYHAWSSGHTELGMAIQGHHGMLHAYGDFVNQGCREGERLKPSSILSV